MILTDTHTHLYVEQFDEDHDAAIQRAIGSGVKRFFLPAIDSTYYDKMFALKSRYPQNVFLMAGLHPTHVGENYKDELDIVQKMLLKKEFCAVGEIGIDLYWDKSFLEQQRDAFRIQIRWAKKLGLPIVIHSRDSFEEIFAILDQENDDALRGIFHCFTGSEQQALKAIDYGFALGIGGVVTFKNGKIDRFLERIPLKHIVMETDAPYLAPVPYRGKRNESAHLVLVLEKLSEIYKRPAEEIAEITTENSKGIFGV